MRLTQTIVRSFDRDIGAVIARLERHARIADQTAVATELLGAAQFRKEADRRQHEELKVQCERWLKPSDVKHIHLHQVQAKLNGTCEWITSNDVFDNWVKPESSTKRDRLLVISGSHGSGKSILASSIVARFEKGQQHPLFFAFSSSDGNRQTSENLIRTLLGQSLHQSDKNESVDNVHRLRLGGQPSVSELWQAFERIIPLLAKPSYCVIDGVDECVDDSHTLFTKLIQVLEKCPSLRILLLGRSHVIQSHSGICQFPLIEITPAILNQDIEAFINNEIAKSDILSLPEFRETVYKSLKGKSDGMFLWVRLMIDDLRKSSSKSELGQRLQDLPCGLEKAYQLLFLRLSQKLDKFEQRLAQSVLGFIITSCRPLTFVEFRYALALHCRSLDTVAQPLEEYLLLQPVQRVLDITEGLLYMADGVLRLSHSSVGDFLVRPEDRWIGEIDKVVLDFRIDVTQTHRSFAWLCLDYIGLETDASKALKLDTSNIAQAVWGSCPLLRYATLYAFHHLNRSGPPCSITLAKVEHLLKSTNIIVHVEHFVHLVFEDVTLDAQMEEFTAWEDQMVDAGLDKRLLALFEGTVKKWTDQMRQEGRYDDPLIEHLDMYLSETKDRQSGASSEEGSREIAISLLHSDTAGQDLQTLTTDSRQRSTNSSATIHRAMDLLKRQTPLSVAHQIELCLRLSTSLRKLRMPIDLLKGLFELILREASRIPVYALMLIGGFYYNLEKFQEALEVYDAASKKMIHLDVPLRFRIYEAMGDCYDRLKSYVDTLRFNEKAFSGYETLLGIRHLDTLRTLYNIGLGYSNLGSYTEALRSYEKALTSYKIVRGLRHLDTLRTLEGMAHCYYQQGSYVDALRFYEEVFSGYEIFLGTEHLETLHSLEEMGICYDAQSSELEALRSFEQVLSGYESLLGTRHPDTFIVLMRMIDINNRMCQFPEVIRLTNKIHMEHGWVPELDLAGNLLIHHMRHGAYRQIGDRDGKAASERCLRETLNLSGESHSNDDRIPPCILESYGYAYYTLREYETALKFFELAIKARKRSKRPQFTAISRSQYWLAMTNEALGRYHEAKVLFETLYAKRQTILGPDHLLIRMTRCRLDDLIFSHFKHENVESENVENDDDERNGRLFADAAIVDVEHNNDESVIDEPDHDTRGRTTELQAQNTVSSDPHTKSSGNIQFDTLPGQNSESELGPWGKSLHVSLAIKFLEITMIFDTVL